MRTISTEYDEIWDFCCCMSTMSFWISFCPVSTMTFWKIPLFCECDELLDFLLWRCCSLRCVLRCHSKDSITFPCHLRASSHAAARLWNLKIYCNTAMKTEQHTDKHFSTTVTNKKHQKETKTSKPTTNKRHNNTQIKQQNLQEQQ